jgi:4-amino-4-deoxy-L-arabinose transferase-like glycosyltransferase
MKAPNEREMKAPDRFELRSRVLLPAVLLLALALRLPGIFSDFWLDEIWTYFFSRTLDSPLQALIGTRDLKNFNAGSLNVLLFYLLGDCHHWVLYRVPSLLTGTASVALAWVIARPSGRTAALLSSLLVALSYPMIHYASEARVYSLAIFFSYAAFICMRRLVEEQRWRDCFVLWVTVALGFLSHLTFLYAVSASGAWWLLRLLRSGRSPDRIALAGARCFGVPLLFLAVYHYAFIRHVVIGAAADYRLLDVLTKALSHAAGGPAGGWGGAAAAILALLLTALAVWYRRRQTDDDWFFYLLAVFVLPLVILPILRPAVLFPRYFLVNIAFGLVAVGMAAAHLFERGRWYRALVIGALVLFVAGNGLNVARLYRHGRGHYLEGLRYLAEHTPGKTVTVASDHGFRNGLVIEFYQRYLSGEKKIVHLSTKHEWTTPPRWFLVHDFNESRRSIPPEIEVRGKRFDLVKTLPYSDLSGWHWYIFRAREAGYR